MPLAAAARPFDPTITVHALVARHPETVAVLRRAGIDPAADGARGVRAAAVRHGVDPEALVDALDGAVRAHAGLAVGGVG